ncbi:unnamed protein product [Musa textilis]
MFSQWIHGFTDAIFLLYSSVAFFRCKGSTQGEEWLSFCGRDYCSVESIIASIVGNLSDSVRSQDRKISLDIFHLCFLNSSYVFGVRILRFLLCFFDFSSLLGFFILRFLLYLPSPFLWIRH